MRHVFGIGVAACVLLAGLVMMNGYAGNPVSPTKDTSIKPMLPQKNVVKEPVTVPAQEPDSSDKMAKAIIGLHNRLAKIEKQTGSDSAVQVQQVRSELNALRQDVASLRAQQAELKHSLDDLQAKLAKRGLVRF